MDPHESFTIIYELFEELGMADKKEFVSLISIPALYEIYIEELQWSFVSDYKSFHDVLPLIGEESLQMINPNIIRSMMMFGNHFKPSLIDSNGLTVLMKLIYTKNDDFLRQRRYDQREDLFHRRRYDQREYLVREFIQKYGDDCLPGHTDHYGETALAISCESKMPKMALSLINTFGSKCAPDKVCEFGKTALQHACSEGLYQVIDRMLEVFGDTCLPFWKNDVNCKTPLEIIDERSQDSDLVRYNTATNFFKISLSVRPVENFKSECLMFAHMDFLGDKFDPSVKFGYDQTFLIYACWRSQDRFALHLIRTYGMRCDPSATDDCGMTALIEACRHNLSKVAIELLTTFGRDCNPRADSESEGTALYHASQNDMKDVIDLLNKYL